MPKLSETSQDRPQLHTHFHKWNIQQQFGPSATAAGRTVTMFDRKWQDYVYIQCEYKSTKQKIKHLLREENKVKENKIS